jgi:O-antigen/teichoic acid export membrane protein
LNGITKIIMNNSSSYKTDIFSTLLNQCWRVFSGPVLLLFIPLFLTPMEQGYWYTFTSVAAFSTLADLGFSNIVLQFAAHEFAFLDFNKNGTVGGDSLHLWKLASFFRFSIRWLARTVCIVFPLIVIGGFYFLSTHHLDEVNVTWHIPWIIYSTVTAFVFINSTMLSFFEGCNSVGKIQQIRFKISVVTSFSMMIGLVTHIGLYALSLSAILASLFGFYIIWSNYKPFIRQLWTMSRKNSYNWWPEFSTLIWRYAISWGSGFLVFQLFTPLVFYFKGPVEAGKIGISIAMWTAGYNIAISWIIAVTPKLNMLIAERKWPELDREFNNSLLKSIATMVAGGFTFFMIDYAMYDHFVFFQRIMSPIGMLVLFAAWLLQVFVNSIAIYLRAHKKEPLVGMSVFNALIVLLGTLLCVRCLNSNYIFLGFFAGSLFQSLAVYRILRHYRTQHILFNGVK